MADALEAAKEIYRRFGTEGPESIYGAITDEVVWKSFAPDDIPWSGEYEREAGVRRFFARVQENHDYVAFYPVEFTCLGNEVAVWGHYCIRHREDGTLLHGDWSHQLVMDGGQIAEFRENYETEGLVRKITGRGA